MILGLPPDPPVLYNRSTELAAIMAAARPAPGGRTPAAVVVHGPPGGGKSALVIKAGHRLADAFPDGRLFLSASGDLLDRALEALDGAAGPDDDPVDRYRSILSERRVLVIVDEVGTAEQVRALVPPPCGSALLVAARTALPGLTGVRRVEIRPLSRT